MIQCIDTNCQLQNIKHDKTILYQYTFVDVAGQKHQQKSKE